MSSAADPTATFLAAIRSTGLLTPDQFRELVGWAGRERADVGGVAKEVFARGWLTPYQIKQTYRGGGRDLTVGRYVLLELLGEGGMGRVFRADDTRLGRTVALKIIRPERLSNPAAMARFDAEMKALGKLDHPNVVRAFDAGQAGDAHFVVMEYIDGADLTKLVRDRGPLPVAEACEYVRQGALGLQHAHDNGLVHRDVKPSNLIATADGKTVKLVDLGLARLNDDGADSRVTREGYVLGTPDFLAPEQARDPGGVDGRADVYALGATLFYLLTGKVPYDAETAADKLVRHLTAPPPSLLADRPDAPPGVERVIHWCLAKRAADRPQTPAELAAALQPFTGGADPVAYYAPPAAAPTDELAALGTEADGPGIVAPVVRRRPVKRGFPTGWVAAGTGLVLLAGAVAAILAYRPAPEPKPDPDRPVEGFANSAGMKLVRVNGGKFRMGSPKAEPGRRTDEGPAREVLVDGPFLMGATEVTHAQYARVTGAAPPGSAVVKRAASAADFPVEMVSYDDAVAFCRRLTEKEGELPTARPGWAYRLPTEAEWEYACRAGTTGPFWTGRTLANRRQALYTPAGEGPGSVLEVGEPDGPVEGIPGKVGAFPPNPWGLLDTHGNVAEWCQDWYAPYPADGPADAPPAGAERV
ncbi:MAG: SUMF1/EgtB/PvdO family nonheme iron enzyme, partial [Gemmataceae bacterium]|nr:SUMF1/EgtB/PvdO family nonheme iron enzyme [Gemmataceae bacterium]